MAVPEASVNKNACSVFRQNYIGTSVQSLYVEVVSVSEPEQLLAQFHFWFRVSGPDMRHTFVTLVGSEDVWHNIVGYCSSARASDKALATCHIITGGTALPIALYCLASDTTSSVNVSGND